MGQSNSAADPLEFSQFTTRTTMNATNLTASEARCGILNLTEAYTAETVLMALVVGLSGTEAREALDYLMSELTA